MPVDQGGRISASVFSPMPKVMERSVMVRTTRRIAVGIDFRQNNPG